jgi:hypothetical protein
MEDIEREAVKKAVLGRKPQEDEEKKIAQSHVANMTRDAKTKVDAIEEEKGDSKTNKDKKNKESSKTPNKKNFGPFSKSTGFDDGMKNDEVPDPNRIRVTLSRGEFESFDQAKMYCEKDFDRLCTEKDMIQAYKKQHFRSCTYH